MEHTAPYTFQNQEWVLAIFLYVTYLFQGQDSLSYATSACHFQLPQFWPEGHQGLRNVIDFPCLAEHTVRIALAIGRF